jgi:hypothetical protein
MGHLRSACTAQPRHGLDALDEDDDPERRVRDGDGHVGVGGDEQRAFGAIRLDGRERLFLFGEVILEVSLSLPGVRLRLVTWTYGHAYRLPSTGVFFSSTISTACVY